MGPRWMANGCDLKGLPECNGRVSSFRYANGLRIAFNCLMIFERKVADVASLYCASCNVQ